MFGQNPAGVSELDGDEFVNVFFGKKKNLQDHGHEKDPQEDPQDFYKEMIEKVSAPRSEPVIYGADLLRRLYPKHSLVMTKDYGLNIFNMPGIVAEPLSKTPLTTNLYFIPLARRLGSIPGVLVDQIELGGFQVNWNQYDFIVYVIVVPLGFGTVTQSFILHDGSEDPARLMLITTGAWGQQVHDEIWVYNQGYWQKDHGLWTEVQKADWKDVILKDEFKKALQKDVYGFFASETIYKDLAIPWKRGLIMWGPPGNGKTISLKAVMKTCGEKGFNPLYVKSFQNWAGDEAGMADVFNKARQLAPCVVILEDLDSLINDRNRSFFLNQLDGLEGNDGLLIIGTTNHFDRLDPGLSTRPSRFDRKFKFDDPDLDERRLYAQYWQKKLASNTAIDFPDQLVGEIAELTDRFSFAYLKEAFVSSLVMLASIEEGKPSFAVVLKDQIAALRKQLDKTFNGRYRVESAGELTSGFNPKTQTNPIRPPRPASSNERDIRALLDALSDGALRVDNRVPRLFDCVPRPTEEEIRGKRDIHALLDTLSDHLADNDIQSLRMFNVPFAMPELRESPDAEVEGRNYRALLDRMAEETRRDIRLFRLQNTEFPRSPNVEHGKWSDFPSPIPHPIPHGPHPEAMPVPQDTGRDGIPGYPSGSEPSGLDLA